jgi:hypothetical protein
MDMVEVSELAPKSSVDTSQKKVNNVGYLKRIGRTIGRFVLAGALLKNSAPGMAPIDIGSSIPDKPIPSAIHHEKDTRQQIEQLYKLDSAINSPDSHSQLFLGKALDPNASDKGNILFISFDNGSTLKSVAEGISAAVFSPYVKDGQGAVFATISDNAETNNFTIEKKLVLWTVDENGNVAKTTETACRMDKFYADFGDGKNTDMFSWSKTTLVDGKTSYKLDLFEGPLSQYDSPKAGAKLGTPLKELKWAMLDASATVTY